MHTQQAEIVIAVGLFVLSVVNQKKKGKAEGSKKSSTIERENIFRWRVV